MESRKIWQTPRAGSIADLTLREQQLPVLADDKIRIRTKAVGLNFADIFALVNLYSATPEGSFIPGLEFSGVVVETGAKAQGFACGDTVLGVTRFGGYASIIDIAPLYCRKLPQGWSYAQGAAYPVQTLTAWYALKTLGDVQPHHSVLIQSAAGGVGLQALKICAALQIHAIGTVSTAAKKQFLHDMGFEKIVIRDRHFAKNVRDLLQERELHIVLEAIGGEIQKQCYRLLAPTGRLIVFGAAQFAPGKKRPNHLRNLYLFLQRNKYDPLDLITDNKSIMGFNLIWLWERTDILLPLLEQLDSLPLAPPYVGKEFAFNDAHAAVDLLRSGKSVGKVVLTL